MKNSTLWSAIILLCCLLLVFLGCGGGSGSGSGAPGDVKLLNTEFSDPVNWTAYETYDQVEAGTTVSALAATATTRSVKRENIVTYTANGLWQIDADLSGSAQVIDHPVWCLYQDSTGTIWAGTKHGIYRQNNGAFERIQDGYVEQFFEFNDIQVLHVHSQGSLWIGSPVSGFNTLDEEGNFASVELVEQVSIGGVFEHGGATYVQGADTVYAIGQNDPQPFAYFSCNGERVYYDASHGKLWAFPNFSDIYNGALAMLDMNTLKIWGTTGDDDREDYWQRDYTWEKPPYHFNEVVAIPDEDAVFIALENGDGKVLKYDYLTDTFSEVAIPVAAISYFDRTDKAVFGMGRGSIVKYEKENWTVVIGDLLSDYSLDLVVQNQYAFVPSVDSLEVAHLVSAKTSLWGFDELPISGRVQTVAMRTNQAPGVTNKAYALSFGTDRGLAICNLNLQ